MALTKLTSVDKSVAKKLLSELSIQISTVVEMKTKSYEVGQVVETVGYYAEGDGGGVRYLIKAAQAFDGYGNHELANGNIAVLQSNDDISVLQFGAKGDNITNDSDAIQAAIDSISVNGGISNVVRLDVGKEYSLGSTGFVIPPNVVVNGVYARMTYDGTGVAITLGNSDTVVSFNPEIRNLNLLLTDKASTGVRLRGCRGGRVEGRIEGGYLPYDNTRTNIGVHIDGVDIGSYFNYLSVTNNHIHENFRIATTGTVHTTQNVFDNCTAFGDQVTDNTSIGYNFGVGATGSIQEGQGSIVLGGNVELCNTGFVFGPKAGSLSIESVRMELNITATAWKFDFIDGCEPITIKGVNGLGTSYMGANSGIRNFNSAPHMLISDDKGSIRLGGFEGSNLNDQTFLGVGGVTPTIQFEGGSNSGIRNQDDATGIGRMDLQAGAGSGSYGGFIRMHGASHASAAGDFWCGPSSASGEFKVTKGLGGASHLTVTPAGNKINMLIPVSAAGLVAGDIWNDSGTVKIV